MTTKPGSKGLESNAETKICKDCKIPFSDIYAYAEHLESKQHKKGVIKTAMKNKYGEKYLAAKAKLDGNDSEEEPKTPDKILRTSKETVKPVKEMPIINEKPVKIPASSSSKDDSSSDDDSEDGEVYTCEVCKKVCTGLLTYQLHLKGKKHLKNVKKVTLLKKMKEQKLIPEANEEEPKEETLFERLFPQSRHVSPNLECKVCKKKCLGPEAYTQHCKSESHKKKVAMEELLKGMEKEGLSPAKDQDQDEDDSTFAHCDVCNKDFSGPLPYMQHMKSISHLKQERNMQQLGKIQNLIISEEEDSKFKCKECGKMFSGPVPFNAHLKSSAHGKIKKKSALIDKLEKKHPELIKTLATENSDDSDDDDSILLGCKVCHMVFSGPEAANDHFTSSKHKKAVKKKVMFKKFKKQQKAGKLVTITNGGKESKKSDSDDSSEFEEEFDIIQEP